MKKRRSTYYPNISFNSKIFLACLTIGILSCRSNIPDDYTIQKGDFTASLTETGELEALNARHILMPFIGSRYGWAFKITNIYKEHGDPVSEGDIIFQIDDSRIQKSITDRKNDLEFEEAVLNKMLVEQNNIMKRLNMELLQEESDYNLKKLELERYQFESEKKRLKKKKEFEQSEIRLQRAKHSIDLAATIHKNENKIQRIRIQQIKNNLAEGNKALKQLSVKSPCSGILQLSVNKRSGEIIRVGDEAHMTMQMAMVPDLSSMKVNTSVNETDIRKINIGQPVIIRVDAFPQIRFNGEVSQIGKLSRQKQETDKNKYFDVVVKVLDSDERLKPGMTVSCEFIYAALNGVLFVSNECLLKEEKKYYIYIRKGERSEKTEVTIGAQNSSHTVINGSFSPCQRLTPILNLN